MDTLNLLNESNSLNLRHGWFKPFKLFKQFK
jgi:hypothetical protein